MHTQILHTCTQCNCAWYLFFLALPLFLPFACFRNSTRLKLQRKNCRKNSLRSRSFYLGIQCLQIVHCLVKYNAHKDTIKQWRITNTLKRILNERRVMILGGPKERDHQDIQSAIYWRSVPVAANCAWNLRMCTATFCIMGTSSSEILIRLYWTKDW